MSTTYDACLQPQIMQQVCSIDAVSARGEVKWMEETIEEFQPSTSTGATNAVLADKVSSNELIGPVVLYIFWAFSQLIAVIVFLCNLLDLSVQQSFPVAIMTYECFQISAFRVCVCN